MARVRIQLQDSYNILFSFPPLFHIEYFDFAVEVIRLLVDCVFDRVIWFNIHMQISVFSYNFWTHFDDENQMKQLFYLVVVYHWMSPMKTKHKLHTSRLIVLC